MLSLRLICMGQWEVPFLLVYIEKMVNSGIVYSCSQVKRNLSMWSIDVYTSWENNHNSHGFAYQKVNKFDIKFPYCFLRFMIITHHFTNKPEACPTPPWIDICLDQLLVKKSPVLLLDKMYGQLCGLLYIIIYSHNEKTFCNLYPVYFQHLQKQEQASWSAHVMMLVDTS